MPGCLLSGSISSHARRGSMRAELRCLAAGQPSRPISVEAPLWSQVVGSAYREDQQRSVSPLRCLSLHLMPVSLPFLFSALSPFGITPPMFSPQITIFPSKSYHCHLSFLPPSPMLCLLQDPNRLTMFFLARNPFPHKIPWGQV